MRIRLLLAVRGTLFRAGIRALLRKIPFVDVVGEARDGREAVALARKARPRVVLLEDALPGLNGVEAASRIVASGASQVAILSDLADDRAVAAALGAGAKGYLLKNDSPSDLARTIRALAQGKVHVTRGVSRRSLRAIVGDGNGIRDRLTPRQRETLQMVAEGWSTKQIAQILKISVKTVETHRAQLMDRLGIYDVPGLVRYALRTRLSHL